MGQKDNKKGGGAFDKQLRSAPYTTGISKLTINQKGLAERRPLKPGKATIGNKNATFGQ